MRGQCHILHRAYALNHGGDWGQSTTCILTAVPDAVGAALQSFDSLRLCYLQLKQEGVKLLGLLLCTDKPVLWRAARLWKPR